VREVCEGGTKLYVCVDSRLPPAKASAQAMAQPQALFIFLIYYIISILETSYPPMIRYI
jgi:hypothetical protein